MAYSHKLKIQIICGLKPQWGLKLQQKIFVVQGHPVAASHKGIIWPRATTAESGSSSRIIVMWPAATNKKLALANTFEEVFVCGLGPQARSSKPYGRGCAALR